MYYGEDNERIVLCHVHDFIIGVWPFLVFKLRKLCIKLNASWRQGREENSTNKQRHGKSKILFPQINFLLFSSFLFS